MSAANQKLGRLPVSTNPNFIPNFDMPSQTVAAILSKLDEMIGNQNKPILKRGNTTAPTFNATEQQIIMDGTAVFDTAGWWVTATHNYIPQKAGYYRVVLYVEITTLASNESFTIAIRKNGTDTAIAQLTNGTTLTAETALSLTAEDIILCNGTTDAIDFALTATAASAIAAGLTATYAVIEFVAPNPATQVISLTE